MVPQSVSIVLTRCTGDGQLARMEHKERSDGGTASSAPGLYRPSHYDYVSSLPTVLPCSIGKERWSAFVCDHTEATTAIEWNQVAIRDAPAFSRSNLTLQSLQHLHSIARPLEIWTYTHASKNQDVIFDA